MLSADMPLHNAVNPYDVNDDGFVAPLDLLRIVNAINDQPLPAGETLYLDVSSDGTFDADDHFAQLAAYESPLDPIASEPEFETTGGEAGPSGPSGPSEETDSPGEASTTGSTDPISQREPTDSAGPTSLSEPSGPSEPTGESSPTSTTGPTGPDGSTGETPTTYSVSIHGQRSTTETKRTPLASDRGKFVISLDTPVHPDDESVTVSFSVVTNSASDATLDADYAILGGQSVTFAAGESEKEVYIEPLNDTESEGNETIRLLLDDPLADNVYLVMPQASITIFDNEAWVWDDPAGRDLHQESPTSPYSSGPLDLWPSFYSGASPNYAYAMAHGHLVEDTLGINNASYSVDAEQNVECDLDSVDGTITCRTYSDSAGLATHGRLSAAVGVDLTVDNTGESSHTAAINFKLFVGADYSYTTTTSGNIGGDVGLKGGSVNASLDYTFESTGSDSIRKREFASYTLTAHVHEYEDFPPLS